MPSWGRLRNKIGKNLKNQSKRIFRQAGWDQILTFLIAWVALMPLWLNLWWRLQWKTMLSSNLRFANSQPLKSPCQPIVCQAAPAQPKEPPARKDASNEKAEKKIEAASTTEFVMVSKLPLFHGQQFRDAHGRVWYVAPLVFPRPGHASIFARTTYK